MNPLCRCLSQAKGVSISSECWSKLVQVLSAGLCGGETWTLSLQTVNDYKKTDTNM